MNNIKRRVSWGAFKNAKHAINHAIRYAVGACAIAWGIAAHAQTPNVPQAWVAYAQLVGEQFQHSLEGYDATASELHAYLEDRMQHSPPETIPSMVDVRAWIGADGSVTRVAFASFGDAQADDDLRAVLMAYAIGVPPPADMRQPLRVRLVLEAKPDPQPAGKPDDAPAARPDAPPQHAAGAS
jgi:hypothetical protein